MDEFLKAAKRLLDSVSNDISKHGGLITRETIRSSDELRIIMARMLAEERKKHNA